MNHTGMLTVADSVASDARLTGILLAVNQHVVVMLIRRARSRSEENTLL